MFGIGFGEIVFILFMVLMIFGSDKVPEIARTLGKGMAQLKNASNEIKHEISKGVKESGVNVNEIKNSISNQINNEVDKAKKEINLLEEENKVEVLDKETIEQIEGTIKRQG